MGRKRGGQIHLRIDGVELTGLNERGDGRPVLGSGVMARKERILPIEGNRPDGPLDAVVVGLDAAVCPRNASSMDGAIDNHLRYEGFQQVGIKVTP